MKKIGKLAAALLTTAMLSAVCPALLPQNSNIIISASAASVKKLNYSKLTIAVGQKVKLIANSAKSVSWKSLDKNIAKVSSNGYVTGAALGKTKIRAKIGGKYYYCTVNVVEPNTNDLFLSMAVGESYKIPLDISKTGVKWISTNPYVATVSSKGTVKVLRKGTAKIYAVVGGKKYLKMSVFSIAPNEDVSYLQNYSIPSPDGGYPIIIHRDSIANYIAQKYDVIDISGYYPKNDGALVSVDEAVLLDNHGWYMDQYKLDCASLTNSNLTESGNNTIYQKGDKFGKFTITDANTTIAKTADLKTINYEFDSYGYNYGIMYTGISAKGTISFKCRIALDDGPDGGYYIDGAQTEKLIEKYNIPTVSKYGAMYLNVKDSMYQTLEDYIPYGKSAEFKITVNAVSSCRRGVYFDESGYMTADVVSLEYSGI